MIEFDENLVGDYLGSCRFWVPGKPRGKARPRFNPAAPGARPYTPAATAAYETLVATRYRGERVEADLRLPHVAMVDIVAYYPIPQRYTKAERGQALAGTLQPTAKPDIDNVAKIILDALNGVAWSDDKCVVDLHVAKYHAAVPGVQITIRWYRAWRRKRGGKNS